MQSNEKKTNSSALPIVQFNHEYVTDYVTDYRSMASPAHVVQSSHVLFLLSKLPVAHRSVQ